MNSRERFLSACACQKVDRRPIWVMRQAGRYLPEYRELKAKYSFHEMVQTPELACEVTLQPLKRFKLDAAILFSDILVIPEALGQPYHFRDSGGIDMEYRINSIDQIKKLNADTVLERTQYVADAMSLVRQTLGSDKALLGFAGSPWSIACFMLEGGTSKHYAKPRCFAATEPSAFNQLMEKITAATIAYLQMQLDCGADAVQIFDSFAAYSDADHYWEYSLRWIKQIIESLATDKPVILYAKGVGHRIDDLKKTGAKVYSLDWSVSLLHARRQLGEKLALQGNLDPALMSANPDVVSKHAKSLLLSMDKDLGFIVNLGHGIFPDARIENMDALVDTVLQHKCVYA